MNSLSARTILFACVVSIISAADAYNMGDRHDVDFMYRYHSNDDNDTVVFFPVIWDVRNTYFVLRDYYSSYGIGGNAWNDLDDLFAEAFDAGVSVVDCRSEIPRMSDRLIIDGPSSTDAFVITARLARDYGLHLIAGGFSNIPGITFHNNKVLEYLDEYRTYETSTVGEFIGVLGFDEPDARFEGPGWNQCQRNQEWYDLAVDYGDMLRDSMNSTTMIYPYATFLDRYRTEGPGGTPKYWQTTIPLFCGLFDAPVLDMYPCFYDHIENITFTDQIEFDDEDIILGSTDLLPSESMYYDAYATQDEIFSVDGYGYLHIYEFINETSHTDTLTVSQHGNDYDLGTVYSNGNGPVWAASDFRATDVGDRDAQGTEHRLNGALVFLDSTDPDNNLVVLHDGTDLTFEEDELLFPAAATIPTTACVGEFNYPVHDSTEASRKGLIGCGELRILVTYQKPSGGFQPPLDMARVYAWDYEGDSLLNVTDPATENAEITLDFKPDGAIWGIFWPSHNYWVISSNPELYSGFIVYDEQGNYQAVFEDIDHGTKVWEVTDYFEEDGIFPLEETSFISRRNAWFPVFCAGADYICNAEPFSTTISKIELDFSTGIGTGNTTHQLAQYTSDPIDLPGDYTVNDLNDAGAARFFKWGYHDDALLVSLDDGSGGSVVYRSTGEINFYGQNGIDLSFGTKEDTDYWRVSSATPILTAPRVYDVRQPYRVPLLLHTDEENPYRLQLIVSDIDVTTSTDRLAELDLAVDRFFELGIEDTGRQNALIHHIRCAGRGEEGWPTFYASEDTLLYEACCDIVHGARGIHLRALDFALMCGNGGSSVPVGVFRAPDLLLNWAPSIETTNTDMISRIHSVIETLSGPGTDPDIFSILVDSSYTALDTNYVMNAIKNGQVWEQDYDPWLNFIALEKTCAADSIEIVLLVVNDYETYADGIIRFPEYDEDDCTLEYIAGFELIYSLRSETKLALDFGLMPAYTASLYRITYEP